MLISATLVHVKISPIWAVVVAQLLKWSLPIPEVRGSNPLYIEHCSLSTALKIKKKRPGMAIKNKFHQFCIQKITKVPKNCRDISRQTIRNDRTAIS